MNNIKSIGKYFIERPPLVATFKIPEWRALLTLRIGDLIKLTFTDKNGNNGERMWVKITSQKAVDQWEGTLNNEPLGLPLMKLGQKIKFHPLDIIDYKRQEDCDEENKI